MGAWYMYFFNTTFRESPWGIQGDVQFRNWNIAGDLEQLLLRGGVTYKPKKADIKLTFGYGNVTTGSYGTDKSTSNESRIYQEALFPVQFGNRLYTNHRFRYEQRFVEGQDLRTRYRYNLFLNIALNKAVMDKRTLYLALYNELFINGQRSFLSKSIYNLNPKVGDLMIFPNYLMHTAYPFNIDAERRSFSFNAKILFKK